MKKITGFFLFFHFLIGHESVVFAQSKQAPESFIETIEGVAFKMIKIPNKNYYLSETEVTQELWEAIMGKGNNPSLHEGCAQCPVEMLTWRVITGNFLRNIRQKTGKAYRLPTIEEWEFAAEGGEDYKYAGSNDLDEVAWYFRNAGGTSQPVKQKKPNGYGLYDMLGNVSEWCQNPFETAASRRCLKGGSFVYQLKGSYKIKNSVCYTTRPIEEDLDLAGQMDGIRLCLTK